jgi:predicted GIY-YIG superfamily endonuclease
MTFWTYMLRCADGRFYVGHTDNLEQRMGQHHQGGFCDFTTRRRPVTLVWSQAMSTREEALAAERQLKGWSRAKKEALIGGDWSRISWLAIPPKERPSTSLRTNGGEANPSREREGDL